MVEILQGSSIMFCRKHFYLQCQKVLVTLTLDLVAYYHIYLETLIDGVNVI